MTKKQRILLLILAVIQFTHIMDFMIMMPLGQQLMRIFQINAQQFSYIVSAYTLSAGLSGFFGAFYLDRFDRKKALGMIYAGFTVGTFACGMAPTYEFLMAARIFTGLFGGLAGATIMSIIGDNIEPEKRGTAMGIVMASFSFASVFGVPFSLYVAAKTSWHMPFIMIASLALLINLFIYLTLPAMNKHLEQGIPPFDPKSTLKKIAGNKSQMNALLLTSLLMLGWFSVIPFISPYMVGNVGFTEEQLAYIYLTGGAVSMITSPLIGKLADKWGKKKTFVFGLLLSVVPILLITHMGHWSMGAVLVSTSLLFICGAGRMIPAQALITSTVLPRERGSFMSINSSVQQLSSSLAAAISGAMVIRNANGSLSNYEWVGVFAAAASLMALLVINRIRPVEEDKKA